ncbi:MAG TPA: GH116 family glycosyl hydrolase, partial [Abditibacteriaceae bacterium]
GGARPDFVFEDWNRDSFAPWTVEGTAFGTRPLRRNQIIGYQNDVGGEGERLVNTHASSPGNDVGARDSHVGKLTSPAFKIERNYIHFWIGGGAAKGVTGINLIVDGKVEQSISGDNDNRMSLKFFDVRALQGRQANLEIVDNGTGPWGNVGVGKITFSDQVAGGKLEEQSDYGTMGLGLLGAPPEVAQAAGGRGGFASAETSAPITEPLVGSLGRKFNLAPNQSANAEFILSWHFPHLEIKGLGKVGRYYASKFDSARAVAQYVATNFTRLSSQTKLFRDTWYDSSLPYWFLDRTLLNASILATSTCFRFADGRFYAWEGVGCCPGTCTHVWHYAHAVARLFPELERDTRERVDLGIAFNQDTGVMGFRAEFDRNLAVDGQAGTILRVYREHQMARDGEFLKRNWPKIKKAFEPLLQRDTDNNGIMEGAQHNTLDTDWYGKVSWLSSLYVAALRAGAAMAREMKENDFAVRCEMIAEKGGQEITRQLFNGEYFMSVVDPTKPDTINSGTGCEIDQVFGQSWAWQVGLPRVLPQKETRSALAALYKYNFTPDAGAYRAVYKPGRWYALSGEAGLLMCTFPRADWDYAQASGKGPDWAAGYFNECMNGFEYQAAGHLIWEGLVQEGLSVARAVHDRYHGARRNPWNEVECGDHYARSMASYGVFTAVCGYEYHGPNGHLGFAPRVSPENFKAAFTTSGAWGSFSQRIDNNALRAEIDVKWGELSLRTLSLALPAGIALKTATLNVNGRNVRVQSKQDGTRVQLSLPEPIRVLVGQKIVVALQG